MRYRKRNLICVVVDCCVVRISVVAKTTHLEVSVTTDFPDEMGQCPDILIGDCRRPERIRVNVVVVVHVDKVKMRMFRSFFLFLNLYFVYVWSNFAY